MNFQKSSVTCERVAVRRRIALAAQHTEWAGLHSLSAVGKVPGIVEAQLALRVTTKKESWSQREDMSEIHGNCVVHPS